MEGMGEGITLVVHLATTTHPKKKKKKPKTKKNQVARKGKQIKKAMANLDVEDVIGCVLRKQASKK